MTLTPESVEAVRQAGQKVASKWQSGFDIRKKVGRTHQRRKRTFKSVAQAVKKKQKKTKADGQKSGATKAKSKTTKSKKNKTKLPPCVADQEQNQGDDQDLAGPVSYSRSAKGEKQIRKSMCRMLAMDKVAFPSKPMFDVDTGLCRLKIFGCSSSFFFAVVVFFFG